MKAALFGRARRVPTLLGVMVLIKKDKQFPGGFGKQLSGKAVPRDDQKTGCLAGLRHLLRNGCLRLRVPAQKRGDIDGGDGNRWAHGGVT